MQSILLNGEEVRTIPGFIGYWISDHGRMYSKKCRRGFMELKLSSDSSGYFKVYIAQVPGGRKKTFLIHHLVMATFHPPRPSHKYVTRHLDGNRQNNSAANLLWGTQSENQADRRIHGRFRRPKPLTETEKQKIDGMLRQQIPARTIAKLVSRDHGTILRMARRIHLQGEI